MPLPRRTGDQCYPVVKMGNWDPVTGLALTTVSFSPFPVLQIVGTLLSRDELDGGDERLGFSDDRCLSDSRHSNAVHARFSQEQGRDGFGSGRTARNSVTRFRSVQPSCGVYRHIKSQPMRLALLFLNHIGPACSITSWSRSA